jgi:hypothetical protein
MTFLIGKRKKARSCLPSGECRPFIVDEFIITIHRVQKDLSSLGNAVLR